LTRRVPSRFAGVLGWPLDHSLSPVIHNAAARASSLDLVYLAFPTPPEALEAAVAGLGALGAAGANVTMPHKEAVTVMLDGLHPDAEAIGAVNTIVSGSSGLTGHNTDIEGFERFLVEDAGLRAEGLDVLVIGGGGAARAIARAAEKMKAGGIEVAARDAARAQAVAGLVDGASTVAWADAAAAAGRADLVINATPVGMAGEDLLPEAVFRSGQTVVDLIYSPPSTPLVERARRAGADAWGGLGMLIHQAAASFELWTGVVPPLDAMSAAAIHALGHPLLKGHSGSQDEPS
jgi:shikimate dehydrogenase